MPLIKIAENIQRGESIRKLTDCAEIAATEYLHETGKSELDSLWLAEFFQDSSMMGEYPKQGLVGFYALVQMR